ncbi:septum site-determining protein MinC [Sulfobacillus thermosulfidooxidans]|uniref:Septum site-determining protein MinC n=2 Tax=Sulfobacillus thermosulfidooxidans TaxID=28034 RepID=A0A1W1W8J1_SULTA|nr:septum site-determining protein MinC [Sulfobacillus thermosulfidooxidans]SMC02617.1 septum site-determining protein MinC [Sulfobacillus thermosulfidooxidans DSM 9293]
MARRLSQNLSGDRSKDSSSFPSLSSYGQQRTEFSPDSGRVALLGLGGGSMHNGQDKPFIEHYVERRNARDWEDEARRHPTLLIRKTLRSGQHVRFYGNVVVLGDVNPGAEITAGGDIIVMGWLRGLAHAGAEGNQDAVVAAFRLSPTQIRIAHFIGRAPDSDESALPTVPEIAEVRDGQLIIDQWQHSTLGNIK